MSYVAAAPRSWVGKSVGDGQCVAYVRTNAYAASTWKQGAQVKGQTDLIAGIVIATFDSKWITQGKPQPVRERRIRFNNSTAKRINNGDEYDVVE